MAHRNSSKQRHSSRVRKIAVKLARNPLYCLELGDAIDAGSEREDVAVRGVQMFERTRAYRAQRELQPGATNHR